MSTEECPQRKQIIEECKAMHNDICIVADCELARLVGFHEDDRDYYYTVRSMGRRQHHVTCVAWCLSLRGLIPDDRYASIDQIFELNGATKAEEFLITSEATGSDV